MKIGGRTILLSVLALGVVLVLGVITSVGWQVVLGPDARPVTDRTLEVTDARLARGEYLVEGPAHCFHCHSVHDLSDPEFPTIQATKGAGWELPIPELGTIPAPNITSDPEAGLGAWTDDEIARAIREGVSRDGRALFPLMPYLSFATLDDEDLASIVVYLRTVPPVRNELPPRELVFPLEYIVKTIPRPITDPQPSHPASTAAERGEYLATIADCSGCHTPTDADGIPQPALAFGGGTRFSEMGPSVPPVSSMNITPDPSGIAHYDEAFFIQVLRSGGLPSRRLSHIMPFEYYRNMRDEDLSDIFAYLQTLAPVKHRVSNDEPPQFCAICGQNHGLGQLNSR
jgi:mono/diheme cytochrome c family protein